MPFDDFKTRPTFSGVGDYLSYKKGVIEFISSRISYSYRLIYRIEPKKILIVAVIHGKRLLESIADRFKEST